MNWLVSTCKTSSFLESKLTDVIAGVALLGAAAAFVTNPILLQLGVISGGRRRRAVDSNIRQRLGEIHLLEQFMAQVCAILQSRT